MQLVLLLLLLFPFLSDSLSFATSRRDILITTTTAPFLTMSSASAVAKPAKEKIRWGIIGLGDVCQVKSGPAFWKCSGSELVAVMRRTPGKAQEFASRVPGGKCIGYDNIDQFLQHDNLDAVYVSTRPGTHLELCQKVAAKGLPCYIEKPVGRCAAETIAMQTAMGTIPFYTAYISRAYTRTNKIIDLIQHEKVLGDAITDINYTLIGTGGARDTDTKTQELPWRLDAKQSGGGLIMDVGCHIIDRIDYLFGPLVNVTGQALNKNSPQQYVEDYVELQAVTGKRHNTNVQTSGAKVSCTWDFAAKDGKSKRDELIITGSNGYSLRMIGMSAAAPIQLWNDKNNEIVKEYTFGVPEHTAQHLIQEITDELRGIKKSKKLSASISRADNAIRTQTVLDTILSSYYNGREIGYWDRPNTWPGRPQK